MDVARVAFVGNTRALVLAVIWAGCMGGCVDGDTDSAAGAGGEELSSTEQAATVCGTGPTVKGIDVSYYQGTIDWAAAKADGVEFAFVRVSDGLNNHDSKFAANWAGTKAKGILRGAYQFFRPGQDAIAQADLLLSTMGPLGANDLPPVIDVEAADGMSAAQISAKVKQWIAHVKAATGRTPIVYTGFYFWRDSVGAPNVLPSPLWHAQYSSAACPNIPSPWTTWAIWQYSSSGRVSGISGNVDMNRFNGTRTQLLALTGASTPPPPATPCAVVPTEGGTIDDSSTCFTGGGPAASLRKVGSAGIGGGLTWTYTTADATEANFGEWALELATSGRYRVEISTPAAFAKSKQARYVVHSDGADHEMALDQAAVDGWQSLGELDFAAGGMQSVHVGDDTGEPTSERVQLAFDAVRLTRVGDHRLGDGAPDPSDGTDPAAPTDGAGCAAAGSTSGSALALLPVLGSLVVLRRRRRR